MPLTLDGYQKTVSELKITEYPIVELTCSVFNILASQYACRVDSEEDPSNIIIYLRIAEKTWDTKYSVTTYGGISNTFDKFSRRAIANKRTDTTNYLLTKYSNPYTMFIRLNYPKEFAQSNRKLIRVTRGKGGNLGFY